jgi:hypothetical protein
MYLKHNLSRTPEYRCWQQIKARCLNPNHRAFPHYGGRGITIAPEWADDFLAFLRHVGPRPSEGHSLDRIDNDAGYVPSNVRWATWEEQAANRRADGTSGAALREVDHTRKTNFKHGMIHTKEYQSWIGMKDRCLNPRSSNYPRWGGRGITISPEWIDCFPRFYADMGPRPSSQHSLDRIDNDGPYSKENCRWATKKEQRANQRPYPSGSTHANATHGSTQTPEYKTWSAIKTRCFNVNHDGYARYGAVGITMCRWWLGNFEGFLADVGVKPSKKHTMGRLDHNGHYSCGHCPECLEKGWGANCRWMTQTEHNRSRRPSERSGKLDAEKVREIRALLALRTPYRKVSEQFGICLSLVGKLKRGENWA